MHKSAANLFKKTRRFADFHAEWFDALERALLPLLRDSLSSSSSSSSTSTQLSAAIHALHCHLQSYYSALNLAASSSSDQLPRLLCPPWRNPLETPFLFLGDLHPYIFTTLLRSLIENDDDGDDSDDESAGVFLEDDRNHLLGRPWQVLTAWKNPSKHTLSRMEQIECGVRLMVPALWDRAKVEQARFTDRVADQWAKASGEKKKETAAVGKAAAAATQGLAGVFLDANRLRKSVLADIMSATNVYQAGLFLEALAQFLVGLRDPELLEKFRHCPVKMR
ncbi:hypothetical protein BT93_D1663 [Corymbia citriodora subsp. variegata]|nr:hypothetical protein BT93_D1663 [Corymbia citriodora subsp. variegata]